MWRKSIGLIFSIAFAACGSSVGSYGDAVEQQADVMRELVDVLGDVDDEASAERAASEIRELSSRLLEISTRMSELPEPTIEDLQEIARTQAQAQQEFQQEAASQMIKLAQYEVLAEAWTEAMMNMR